MAAKMLINIFATMAAKMPNIAIVLGENSVRCDSEKMY